MCYSSAEPTWRLSGLLRWLFFAIHRRDNRWAGSDKAASEFATWVDGVGGDVGDALVIGEVGWTQPSMIGRCTSVAAGHGVAVAVDVAVGDACTQAVARDQRCGHEGWPERSARRFG